MESNFRVDIEIKSFKTLFEGKADSVFYICDLKYEKNKWSLDKRYSDLRSLYD